jgi:lysophospholipase L1-like esterase
VQAQAARIDICCDGKIHRSAPLLEGPGTCDLPSGAKLVEIWLPQYCEVLVRGFDVDEGASLRPFHDERPRLLFYGSSNTQSKGAESPVFAWPAIFARHHDLNLTNLGYGSACHLDPMVARMMRDLPADLIAMELGINIYINAALNAVALRAAFIGFVQILREGHPDVPIAVMSSIYADWRESTPNAVGLTLTGIREELALAVDDLRSLGDANLHYFDGLGLFGADMAAMLPDQLHPGVDGHKILGERFAARVGEAMPVWQRSPVR